MNISTQNTESLRDIHLPDPISWWPPAIGWWILLAIIVAAFILIPKLYRRITYSPIKKVAHITFQNIVNQYNENKNDSNFVNATSQFLRQTAMSYCGRESVAQLTGEKWLQALNDMTEHEHFTDEIKQSLCDAPYQTNSSIDVQQLINTVQSWLSDLPKKLPKGPNK